MAHENLKNRIKLLALRVIRLVDEAPDTRTSRILCNQIVRSATSIASNYRASCFAKSKKDFINKLKIAEEETDETIFWLEIFEESGLLTKGKISTIHQEAREVFAILVASIKTARINLAKTSNL